MATIKLSEPDKDNKVECPVCNNEDIELGQKFCQICGEPFEWIED